MWFPDLDAKRRFPAAADALDRGDAPAALAAVERLDHPAALRLAGRALLALGDRDGARRAFLRALEACAPDDPGAAVAHAELAHVERAVGEPADAVRHLERALELAQDPAAAELRAQLHREAAVLSYRAGDIERAEPHARAALCGDDGGVVGAQDRARLGAILSEQGQHIEAVSYLSDAAESLVGALGADHVDVLAVRAELADALEAAGDLAAAEAVHLSVLEHRAASPGGAGGGAPDTLLALSALAQQRGDAAAAQTWAARAYALLDGRVSADHPQLKAARAASGGRS